MHATVIQFLNEFFDTDDMQWVGYYGRDGFYQSTSKKMDVFVSLRVGEQLSLQLQWTVRGNSCQRTAPLSTKLLLELFQGRAE